LVLRAGRKMNFVLGERIEGAGALKLRVGRLYVRVRSAETDDADGLPGHRLRERRPVERDRRHHRRIFEHGDAEVVRVVVGEVRTYAVESTATPVRLLLCSPKKTFHVAPIPSTMQWAAVSTT